MNRGRKKSYLISAVTLALLFAAFLLVFRDALPEILTNLRTVPFRGVLLLLVLGFAYEGMEAAVGFVLLRRKKKDVRFLDALNTTFLGVFGNIATMGAGTLPMQSFYLYRRGLDAGGALGIMASEYVLHKISVLLYATAALLLGGGDSTSVECTLDVNGLGLFTKPAKLMNERLEMLRQTLGA